MKLIILTTLIIAFTILNGKGQQLLTPFEKSNEVETTTYAECINFYKQLSKQSPVIKVIEKGNTDAGNPLHLVLLNTAKKFTANDFKNKVVILINNGIHAGEPDGIDASMLLARDIVTHKINLPQNVVLAIIPVYNIGGSLNRNSFTRVNQNGPLSYGFRGNAQNLDLNRDFIKCDSKESIAFAEIFHQLNPQIFIDTHVSDGADYQHTMTLLTTQHNKLGGVVGNFLHKIFEPAIYKGMQQANWDICPYVNFETANPDKGWQAFYDAPRYSSGYAALFGTMAFVAETHMLKPFNERVKSTYALLQTIINTASFYANDIINNFSKQQKEIGLSKHIAASWIMNKSITDTIQFKGYEAAYKKSDVTGFERLYYNHTKPFTKQVLFYNYYIPAKIINKPKAYVIPVGWHHVIYLLKKNNVTLYPLLKDTTITVTTYYIKSFTSATKPYEKHFKHNAVTLDTLKQTIAFKKGDYYIPTGFYTDRFLMEVLEPETDDSYFKWNFFDAVLQQKEGYSDYRWEDLAYDYLQKNEWLQNSFKQKLQTDSAFAQNANAQLYFIYKYSPYYEKEFMRYPVFRIE